MVTRALVESAKDPMLPSPASRSLVEADLVEAASVSSIAQGIGSAFHETLERTGIRAPAFLGAHRTLVAARRVSIASAIMRISATLDSRGTSWVSFGGPVIALAHRHPLLRNTDDPSVLVAGTDLRSTLASIESAGGFSINRNWDSYLSHGVGVLPVQVETVVVNLHWSLIDLACDRKRIHFDTRGVLERSRRIRFNDLEIPSFETNDQLVQLCLKEGLASATRIGPLRDIHEAVSTSPPDWMQLTERIKDCGAASMIAHVLDRSRQTFNTPVPDEFLRQWLSKRRLERRRRQDSRPGDSLRSIYQGSSVSTTRDNLSAMCHARARRAIGGLLKRFGPPTAWDPTDESGVFYWNHDAGGDEARNSYLDLASREG